MKLCRFDEDRLGVVIGDKVHDVTDIQTQIRAAAASHEHTGEFNPSLMYFSITVRSRTERCRANPRSR